MAANTPSVWTESRVGYTGSSLYKATCTVLADIANTDASTKPTPQGLNVRKPWSLILSCATTPDGQALPFEIWGGTSDSFVMSTSAGSATAGVYLKQLSDDVVLSVAATPQIFQIIPNTFQNDAIADIVTIAAIATGFRVRVPVMPYYAFNLNGGSVLAAVITTYTIIQG
jgi:hypothetical protein